MNSVYLKDLVDREKCTATLKIDKLRQPAFVCLTCQDNRIYCRACKHKNHNVAALGMRRFQCENGLQVTEPLVRDGHNHNRKGRFCYCDSHEQQHQETCSVMWQCMACEDWFHVNCIKNDLPWIEDETEGVFVCRSCNGRLPFTNCMMSGGGDGGGDVGNKATAISLLLPSNWKPPCDCLDCKKLLQEVVDDDFFEIEDDEEKVGDDSNNNSDDDDDLNQLDKSAVLRTIDGYNALKVKLCTFLQSMPSGHVVTAEEIFQLFQQKE